MNSEHTDYTDDPNFRAAQLGVEAESFLHSSLGRALTERCEHDIEIAYQALAVVSPGDMVEILRLQQQVAVARYVPQYLSEVMAAGRLAEDVLHDYEGVEIEADK